MLTCCPTTCESGIHPGNNHYKRVGLFSTLSTIPRSCYGGHGNSLFYLDKQPTSWGRLSVPGPRRIQNPVIMVMVFFVIPTVQAAGRSRLLRPGQANCVFKVVCSKEVTFALRVCESSWCHSGLHIVTSPWLSRSMWLAWESMFLTSSECNFGQIWTIIDGLVTW